MSTAFLPHRYLSPTKTYNLLNFKQLPACTNIVQSLQLSDKKGLKQLRKQFSPTYPQAKWV
jgi:hypothetical protein